MDKRIMRTKKLLKYHFIDLIKEKGYKNVKVTDIIVRAEYNRSTFYLYFKDKEDLAEELVAETLEQLQLAFRQPFINQRDVTYERIIPTSNTFFQHLYDHQHFYSLLLVEDIIPMLSENFLKKFKEIFYGLTYMDEHHKEIHLRHFNTYKMYGSYGVILEWIEDGFVNTPDEIANILLEIFKTNGTAFKFNRE